MVAGLGYSRHYAQRRESWGSMSDPNGVCDGRSKESRGTVDGDQKERTDLLWSSVLIMYMHATLNPGYIIYSGLLYLIGVSSPTFLAEAWIFSDSVISARGV